MNDYAFHVGTYINKAKVKLSSHVNKISFGEEGIRLKYSFMELKGKVVVPFV